MVHPGAPITPAVGAVPLEAFPGGEAARAAHERIRLAVRTHRSSMHTLAVELLAFEEEGHAAMLGFGSVAAYAREVHELSPRTVRDLIALARALRTLPGLDQSLAAGEIAWTKARTLLPVLTDDNERAWIDAARGESVRAVEAMVSSSLPGELPPAPEACRAAERVRRQYELSTVEAELVDDVLARERARLGPVEVSDGELLAAVFRHYAHDQDPTCTERYQIVLQHCPRCGETSGRRAEVEEAIVSEAACDSEIVDLVSDGAARGQRSRTIPTRTRRAVQHVYGGMCAVPGCRHRLWVDVHHVRAYADGGSHEEPNLVLLCTAHHRMLHQGRMGLQRDAGDWVFRFPWGPERRRPLPHLADGAATAPGGRPHLADGAATATGGRPHHSVGGEASRRYDGPIATTPRSGEPAQPASADGRRTGPGREGTGPPPPGPSPSAR